MDYYISKGDTFTGEIGSDESGNENTGDGSTSVSSEVTAD